MGPRRVAALFSATAAVLSASNAWAEPRGVAVVATAGATDAAWSLAQDVYADPALRPSIGERKARVLAGEDLEGDDLKPLRELRAGVKGEDAASKQLLSAIADEVDARGLVLVSLDGSGHATARSFIASSRSFDAASYTSTGEGADLRWPGVAASLHALWAPTPATPVARSVAQPSFDPPIKNERPSPGSASSKPFYLSPWFWGAIGAAVVGAVALILATQDLSSDTIKLQLKVAR